MQKKSLQYFKLNRLVVLFVSAFFLSACGGGSSDTTSPTLPITPIIPQTYSVTASVVKGPVTGANCVLSAVNSQGTIGASIASASSVNGLVDFGNSIEYQGSGLLSCEGGTYTDESSGDTLTAPILRAVVNVNGNSAFVVSPLTEIAVQKSGADLGSALTTHNAQVAASFGLNNIAISNIVPTDLVLTNATNNSQGQYATILALLSQLNNDDSRSLEAIIADLASDLADGTFSESTLASLTNAEGNLGDSAVASNLSDAALTTVTANAGIPDPATDNGNGNNNDSTQPNILVIISDDQGLDSSAEYNFSMDPPTTPNISALAQAGVTFQNVWSSPACAPTRASILTGKFGINNDVISVPGNINEDDQIIYEFLKDDPNTKNYASAYIGKWHLASGQSASSNPVENGIPYFAGALGNIDNYDTWQLSTDSAITNASTVTSTEYNTSKLTRLAQDWIADQDSPWMMMLAYNAPHGPMHWPNESLHTRRGYSNEDCINAPNGANETNRECFLAMIEAMDTEIGNLLDSMTPEQRDNTLVIYLGDNGTANSQRDPLVFANAEVKGTLFEGGVRVPMVVSGAGVLRKGVREERLVTVSDIYATVAELAGSDTHFVYDSLSFAGFLSSEDGENRQHAYADYLSDSVDGWTVRNHKHQLIHNNNVETLYALNTDNFDRNDVTASSPDILYELQIEAAKIRSSITSIIASALDFDFLDITEHDHDDLFSIRASTCARFVKQYTSTAQDLRTNNVYNGELSINLRDGICSFETNNVPNHNFQEDANFASDFNTQNYTWTISATPKFADAPTQLIVPGQQGVLLNGVKVDILAAACLGVSNERTQCTSASVTGDDEWRFDPMFAGNGFQTDTNNAHTQPSGAYHYHGNPNALFDRSGNLESGTVGFAADGFPIFGSYIKEDGVVRKVRSSYQLKPGNRPVIDVGGSSAQYSEQAYNGAFRQDYQYVENSGDLDICNGMWKDGYYGYYIIDEYPYMLGCFSGTQDDSFK